MDERTTKLFVAFLVIFALIYSLRPTYPGTRSAIAPVHVTTARQDPSRQSKSNLFERKFSRSSDRCSSHCLVAEQYPVYELSESNQAGVQTVLTPEELEKEKDKLGINTEMLDASSESSVRILTALSSLRLRGRLVNECCADRDSR